MSTIIDLLIEDHDEFKELFAKYEDDPEGTFQHLKHDLDMHTRIEEELLYPALEEYDVDRVSHARREHHEADAIVMDLDKDPSDLAIFNRLRAGILHHVKDEEGDFFPFAVQKLGEDKVTELYNEAFELKERLKAEL